MSRKKALPPARQQLVEATADCAPVLVEWLRILAPDLPTATQEYRFIPDRAYRFDMAWPDKMLACEVDGGRNAPRGGKHASDADYEKLNSALLSGWRVLRFTTHQVTHNPAGCVEVIAAALTGAPFNEDWR
jgi:Protein of unknown function (DUF559)